MFEPCFGSPPPSARRFQGVIGLGLPTVSMGLLAVTMQPARVPSSSCRPSSPTSGNLYRPLSRDIIRRLWLLMVGT
jgi:hypothetical protein